MAVAVGGVTVPGGVLPPSSVALRGVTGAEFVPSSCTAALSAACIAGNAVERRRLTAMVVDVDVPVGVREPADAVCAAVRMARLRRPGAPVAGLLGGSVVGMSMCAGSVDVMAGRQE